MNEKVNSNLQKKSLYVTVYRKNMPMGMKFYHTREIKIILKKKLKSEEIIETLNKFNL